MHIDRKYLAKVRELPGENDNNDYKYEDNDLNLKPKRASIASRVRNITPQDMFSESIIVLPLIHSPLSWPYTCNPLDTLGGQIFQGSNSKLLLSHPSSISPCYWS